MAAASTLPDAKQADEEACWEALQDTYGFLMIRLSSPDLAQVYRADRYGYVVCRNVADKSEYAVATENTYPISRCNSYCVPNFFPDWSASWTVGMCLLQIAGRTNFKGTANYLGCM